VIQTVLRSLRPQSGALANARDAVRQSETDAADRRLGALELAQSQGPRSWQPLHQRSSARERPGHAVHFAASDADLVGRLALYVADGLSKGEVCLVVATAEHRSGLHEWLAASGLDTQAPGRLVEFEAQEVMERLMSTGTLDLAVFEGLVEDVITPYATSGEGFRVFGEIVGLLHRQGDLASALDLERRWEIVHRRLGFPLLCAYVDPGESDGWMAAVGQICGTHTHLAS
jgi:hypothetical protein